MNVRIQILINDTVKSTIIYPKLNNKLIFIEYPIN